MKLCVRADSIRIIETAAQYQVQQIVYPRANNIGVRPEFLVERVKDLSGGVTKVVLGNAGALPKEHADNTVAALDTYVAAGFDALHLDMTNAPYNKCWEIGRYVRRYSGKVALHVGDPDAFDEQNIAQALVARQNAERKIDFYAFTIRLNQLYANVDRMKLVADSVAELCEKTIAYNADHLPNIHQVKSLVDAYVLGDEMDKIERSAMQTGADDDTIRGLLEEKIRREM